MEGSAIRYKEPIRLTVSFPKTEAGQNELSRRVAAAHAAAVNQQLKSLKCPDSQKLLLLNAIIDTVKSKTREPY